MKNIQVVIEKFKGFRTDSEYQASEQKFIVVAENLEQFRRNTYAIITKEEREILCNALEAFKDNEDFEKFSLVVGQYGEKISIDVMKELANGTDPLEIMEEVVSEAYIAKLEHDKAKSVEGFVLETAYETEVRFGKEWIYNLEKYYWYMYNEAPAPEFLSKDEIDAIIDGYGSSHWEVRFMKDIHSRVCSKIEEIKFPNWREELHEQLEWCRAEAEKGDYNFYIYPIDLKGTDFCIRVSDLDVSRF